MMIWTRRAPAGERGPGLWQELLTKLRNDAYRGGGVKVHVLAAKLVAQASRALAPPDRPRTRIAVSPGPLVPCLARLNTEDTRG